MIREKIFLILDQLKFIQIFGIIYNKLLENSICSICWTICRTVNIHVSLYLTRVSTKNIQSNAFLPISQPKENTNKNIEIINIVSQWIFMSLRALLSLALVSDDW